MLILFYLCLVSYCSFNIASGGNSAYAEGLFVQPTPVVQLQFPYHLNTDYVSTTTTGLGSVTHSVNMAELQTGVLVASLATLQSKARLSYQSGQGCRALFAGYFTQGTANSTQILGVGSANDGFFFGYNGTSFGILHRSSSSGVVVDTWTSQASWNGTLINFDPTKGNVYKIKYQWLGFGVIEFYIEDPADGSFVLVHTIRYPNNNTIPNLRNPSLALYANVTASIHNDVKVTLKVSSMAAIIDGKNCEYNQSRFALVASPSSLTTTETNILTIQNNLTYAGTDNQVIIYPDMLTMINPTSTAAVVVTLYLNSPATLPALTSVGTYSVTSFSTTGIVAIAGKPLLTLFCSSQNGNREGRRLVFNLHDQAIRLNPGDQLIITAKTSSGTITNFHLGLSWFEKF